MRKTPAIDRGMLSRLQPLRGVKIFGLVYEMHVKRGAAAEIVRLCVFVYREVIMGGVRY